MKFKNLIIAGAIIFGNAISYSETRYVGGDISLLPEYESAGAKYKDENNKPISDLLPFLYDEGMNAMRVRLFVDPDTYAIDHPYDPADPDNPVNFDPNACQSLPYIIPLCKRIIDNGFSLLLDFHYTDQWADPGKQWIPKAWEGLNDEELILQVYEYTKNTLQTLSEEGIVPAFIQPGNEISYGMLWSPLGGNPEPNKTYLNSSAASWERLGRILDSAILACREECPDAKIIIHTERVSQVDVQNNFYKKMRELGVDYDIIGLSYYPYFHGNMSVLNKALTSLEENFPEKEIMIVETGFPYKWAVPGSTEKVDYEYSAAGQDEFAHELVDTLLAHESVTGLFWWWLEYNAFGTQLSGWYNAPLFDSLTGMALPALKTICSFASEEGSVEGIVSGTVDSDSWFDIQGRKINNPVKGEFYIRNGKKIIF